MRKDNLSTAALLKRKVHSITRKGAEECALREASKKKKAENFSGTTKTYLNLFLVMNMMVGDKRKLVSLSKDAPPPLAPTASVARDAALPPPLLVMKHCNASKENIRPCSLPSSPSYLVSRRR